MHRQQQGSSKTTLTPGDKTEEASAAVLWAVGKTKLLGDTEITALGGNWGDPLHSTFRLCLHFPAEVRGCLCQVRRTGAWRAGWVS